MTSVSVQGARLLACAFSAVLAACSGSSGPVDGSAALAHVEQLVKIGKRPFGSDGLAKAADYIAGEVGKLGLQAKRQEVADDKEKKTIRNLYAQIDGDDPQNGPILMLGAHYDTKLSEGFPEATKHNINFVGAIDGGGAPAVLLELAKVLKQPANKPKVNVWLFWIDAEESIDWDWNNARALLGSKAFVKMLDEQKILPRVKAFVLLDLIGDKNIKLDRDGNSNGDLQKIFEKAAADMGESARMYRYPSKDEIAQATQRRQAWGTIDDHIVFRDHGVASLLLIDFSHRLPPENQGLRKGQPPQDPEGYAQWWHTEADSLDKMSAASLAFAGNLVLKAMPALETYCKR